MNSREKGKRGERQWRDELRAHGYLARRGQQFAGGAESPDVVCPALPWAHFEVKLVERLDLYQAMEQARADVRKMGDGPSPGPAIAGPPSPAKAGEGNGGNGVAGWDSPALPRSEAGEGDGPSPRPSPKGRGRKVPIVAHRRNHWPWLVTMDAETFFALVRGQFTTEAQRHGETVGESGSRLPQSKAGWEACATAGLETCATRPACEVESVQAIPPEPSAGRHRNEDQDTEPGNPEMSSTHELATAYSGKPGKGNEERRQIYI